MADMSPEVMQALGRGKPPPGQGQAPGSSGMMTPQKPAGEQEKGRVKALVAMKMLEQALAAFGATSKEGTAVLAAIRSLAKQFGKQEGDTQDLLPAEKKTIAAGLPDQQGGAPPGGPPGAPPGAGAPPGMPPGGAPPMAG